MQLILAYELAAKEWANSAVSATAGAVFLLLVAAGLFVLWLWMFFRPREIVFPEIVDEPDRPPMHLPPRAFSSPLGLHWLFLGASVCALLVSITAGGCSMLARRHSQNAKANAAWAAGIVEQCRPAVENSQGPWSEVGPSLQGKLFVWDLVAKSPTPAGYTSQPSWVMRGFGNMPSSVRASRDDQELTACFIVDAAYIPDGAYQEALVKEDIPAYAVDLKIVAVYWPSLQPAGCFVVHTEPPDEVRRKADTSGRFYFQLGHKILSRMKQ